MSISGLSGSPYATRGAYQPPSFASLDTNGDGSITLDELEAKAPGGANATSDARTQKLFSAMDTNGDGSISADEKSAFDQKVSQHHGGGHHGGGGLAFLAQQLSSSSDSSVFAATDTNSDGSVSLDEFSADPAAKGVSSDNLKQVFNLIDSDGDGSLSESETSSFLDQIKSALAGQSAQSSPEGVGSAPPPPPPPADNSNGNSSADLLSLAQNAYASTQQTDLLSTLQSLLQTAA